MENEVLLVGEVRVLGKFVMSIYDYGFVCCSGDNSTSLEMQYWPKRERQTLTERPRRSQTKPSGHQQDRD